MLFTRYDDVHLFYADTYDVLERAGAQNLIILGNLTMGDAGKDTSGWRDPAGWFMGTVGDDSGIRLIALMTPPRNLLLYEVGEPAAMAPDRDPLTMLLEELAQAGISLPGVTTEAGLATRLAAMYNQAHGSTATVTMRQRIYELTSVNPQIPMVGDLRPATEKDMAFVPYWAEGFCFDCSLQDATGLVDADATSYHYLIDHSLYVLEADGVPVAMAKIQNEAASMAGVSWVYTPPYFRSHGYASACVAALSRLILNRGFTRCALYTDLSNPISNSIYQQIGYRPVCDSMEIAFHDAG